MGKALKFPFRWLCDLLVMTPDSWVRQVQPKKFQDRRLNLTGIPCRKKTCHFSLFKNFIFVNEIPRLKKIPRNPRSRLLYDHVRKHFMEINNSAFIPHQYIPVNPNIPPGISAWLSSATFILTRQFVRFMRRNVKDNRRNLRKLHTGRRVVSHCKWLLLFHL